LLVELPIRFEVTVKQDERLLASLDQIVFSLQQIVRALPSPRPIFKLEFETIMPTYKATHPDFTFRVRIRATDAEGHSIADAPIPAGFSLSVVSDATAVFSVALDPTDASGKQFLAHVEGPLPGSESSTANVTASLFDATSNLVASGVSQVIVTVGDPTAITEIVLDLPPSDTTV
jgi:hypothetical protein